MRAVRTIYVLVMVSIDCVVCGVGVVGVGVVGVGPTRLDGARELLLLASPHCVIRGVKFKLEVGSLLGSPN